MSTYVCVCLQHHTSPLFYIMQIAVERKYPVCYRESLPAGGTVMRSAREEEQAAAVYERTRQRAFEDAMAAASRTWTDDRPGTLTMLCYERGRVYRCACL